jgi:hypothetical protein
MYIPFAKKELYINQNGIYRRRLLFRKDILIKIGNKNLGS